LKITGFKQKNIPKIAVLAAGLAVATMAATIHPAPVAQAYPTPPASNCTGCHSAGGSVAATAPTTPLAPGAAYTVSLAFTGGSGNSGYAITGGANAVIGSAAAGATRTQAMTAPAVTTTYTVYMRQGVAASAQYTITVAAAPVVVTTTTALAVSPASPVVAPGSPTLRATVSGAGAAGTVQFFNGTTSLGAATAISAGVASKTLTGIAAGSYAYTAKFVPTNAGAFTPSTSSVSTYVVTATPPVVVTTTTALAVSPASPVVAPGSPTLRATVTGAGTAGSVAFFDGTTSLGISSAVTAGVATKALTGVVAGAHSYTAVFTPTSAAAFTPSTSLAVAYVVTASVPSAVTTTTTLAVTPASPVVAPASPTLTATVTGAGAAGSVEFFNGTNTLGTSPVVGGVATKGQIALGANSYSYTAVFTPTSAAAFTPSTSLAVAYLVTASVPTSTTAQIISLSSTRGVVGSRVTIRGTGFGSAGVVNFGANTARIVSWSTTAIVVRVPSTNSVTTRSNDDDKPVWYSRGLKVPVTVTPAGAGVSNAVTFRVSSYSEHDDD
jgi:Bacterial Ig-like domain (group 3)